MEMLCFEFAEGEGEAGAGAEGGVVPGAAGADEPLAPLLAPGLPSTLIARRAFGVLRFAAKRASKLAAMVSRWRLLVRVYCKDAKLKL